MALSEEFIKQVSDQNLKLLFLLGYAAGMLAQVEAYTGREEHDWFRKAMKCTISTNEPWPEIP